MNSKPTILIIFGISGDLAKRYLLPGIEELRIRGELPEKFEVVGITRQTNPELFQMDVTKAEEYERLGEHLVKIEESFGAPAQRIFYLSVPPEGVRNIIELLGSSLLIKGSESENKIVLEKPFGFDLESAKELLEHTDKYFKSEQIYRVDHYLMKGTRSEMLGLRESEEYKNTWSKDFIESIHVVASEKIGIEGRVNFYEQTGALRDFLQSHLLELTALALMETKDGGNLQDLRYEVLKNLNIVCDIKENQCVKRAQYKGYREEVGVSDSMVETFVSINLRSNDPTWTNVPITLSTGKNMDEKFTKIKIKHKTGLLEFNFKDTREALSAYGAVIKDAILGKQDFFISSKEILESWRIVDPVQKMWKEGKGDLVFYEKGSKIDEIIKLYE